MRNSSKILPILVAALIFQSCHTSISKHDQTSYFDIPKFFKNEALRLQKLSPTITKTVATNTSTETKEINIKNWNSELAQFMTVDLNKAGNIEFQMTREKDTLVYSSQTDSPNRIVVKIVNSNERTSYISIEKQTKNLLFKNNETLIYSLDDFYSIEKNQSVKGLGHNSYLITSKL
ncbi:hypothetical protein [Sphingobacterium bovistauri]|uniref:Uncharacterized protein n=1 Tax=Sphingobacterium bovistauri TaxID=2781959 RepID=A0ABS7Z0J4_9SPHI|nr:hypothetical protein [Sphingobacterium bovistauri]MCA5003679.1 hypothetical protein [Sphingobacterium bovistauri]